MQPVILWFLWGPHNIFFTEQLNVIRPFGHIFSRLQQCTADPHV